MALKSALVPPELFSVVREHLDKLHKSVVRSGGAAPLVGPRPLYASDRSNMTTSAAHPVYDLGLRDIADGKDLSAAVHSTWRCFLEDASAPVAFADMTASGNHFAGFTSGPQVIGFRRALESAEGLEAVAKVDYEVRVLRVPGLSILALWLFALSDTNLILPIRPTPEELVPERPYKSSDFFVAIRPSAVSRLAFVD